MTKEYHWFLAESTISRMPSHSHSLRASTQRSVHPTWATGGLLCHLGSEVSYGQSPVPRWVMGRAGEWLAVLVSVIVRLYPARMEEGQKQAKALG